MEEDLNNPSEINSVDVNKVLHSSIVYWNKKRKFQDEQLGLPLPKHKCWYRSVSSEFDSPSDKNLEAKNFRICINKRKDDSEAIGEVSDQESAGDSNSFAADGDSSMSVSGEAKMELEYAKASSSELRSTSSDNWSTSSSKNILYSLDSRLMTISSDSEKPTSVDRELDSPHQILGLHIPLNFDDHLLELENHIGYGCSDHENEQYTDKALEDMLYSNGVIPNNYVLSSGRWNVNQETQPGKKKLTIDKEFEEYFSMLML
ncbi:uncharacterized protein LOC132293561 [Cornus florida]|uniref:uncharacterized protein LOC132293561 n=1 Tax=Cornus florida TaxID=4283 RepID=UPI0028A196CF|nr:uncharacterized protein LOC132293561 [Cornus florida]